MTRGRRSAGSQGGGGPAAGRGLRAGVAGLSAAALGAAGVLLVPVTGSAAGDPAPTAVCPAATTTAGGVVRCGALFGGARPLRLPADPSVTSRYGAFRRGDGTHLSTRGGLLKVTGAIAEEIGRTTMAGGAGPGYARTVYLATVSGRTVTALKPAVIITESAIMRRVFGGKVLEGRIGARVPGTDTYSETVMLPIRVQLAVATRTGVLSGRIENASRAVRAAGGRCLPSLAKSGARDPLTGRIFTPRIGLQRRPSMHLPFDDELIVRWSTSASDMGQAFYPSVATLMGADPLGRRWRAYIHGVPDLGPALDLHLAFGGGGSCR